MKVQIKTPSDDIELDVEPHWTIKWIKAILVEKTNEPVALQHLFFDGKELEDHVEIQSCRLHPSNVIYLIVDPDAKCALVSRIDDILAVLKDISKSKLFRKI